LSGFMLICAPAEWPAARAEQGRHAQHAHAHDNTLQAAWGGSSAPNI